MKRSTLKVLLVLALGTVICLPGVALADFVLSSTVNGASTYWSAPAPGPQTPYYGTVPAGFSFTSFATEFSDTTLFAGNGTIGYGGTFVSDGWTAILLNGTTSLATGPAASRPATWDYSFIGSMPIYPITFDINYFNGATFVGHEHYTIGRNGGDYAGGFDLTQHAMVPLPPTVLLLASGLLGLGLLGRRKFKKTDA